MNDPRRAEARRLRQETRMSLAQLRDHFGVSRDTMADWLFLRFMELLGRDRSSLRYRLSIHETADVGAATRSWAAEIGVAAEAFQRATIIAGVARDQDD
jgi:hypothetical protein